MGKDQAGKFKPARLCPVGERVVGYRAQVQKADAKDKVGLSGLQMKCSGGKVIGPDGIVDAEVGMKVRIIFCFLRFVQEDLDLETRVF